MTNLRRFGVQRRSKSGKNISLKISVNSLLSSILYIYDRPRLPFCKLGCRITKYVQWNILIITSYYKTLLLRTTLSWSFMISCVIVFYLITFLFNKISWLVVIVFYFTNISVKTLLYFWSHRGSCLKISQRGERWKISW